MSGGSFNYLYAQDAGKIMSDTTELHEMLEWLERNYPSAAATRHTLLLLDKIERLANELDSTSKQNGCLRTVWKAVEMYVSCDWGADDVAKAIMEYGHDYEY